MGNVSIFLCLPLEIIIFVYWLPLNKLKKREMFERNFNHISPLHISSTNEFKCIICLSLFSIFRCTHTPFNKLVAKFQIHTYKGFNSHSLNISLITVNKAGNSRVYLLDILMTENGTSSSFWRVTCLFFHSCLRGSILKWRIFLFSFLA